MREWRYSSTHSKLRRQLEVSGQFHAPSASTPGGGGGSPWYPLVSKLDRLQSPSGREENNTYSYLESNPDCLVSSSVSVLTEISWLLRRVSDF
jgi:hypothetical protein